MDLHNQHDEGGADRFTDWDSLPDYVELARACRFRDGRENNQYNAPPELYPHLAMMLSYCKVVLLRRHVCSLQIIPDDAVPIVDGPKQVLKAILTSQKIR